MAFKGGAAPVKPGMQDRIDSNIARDGAAKKVQAKSPLHSAMKEQQDYRDATHGVSGSGPDASSPNPLAKEAISKGFKDAPTAWNMRDANGQSVNHELGHAVLKEAALTGR